MIASGHFWPEIYRFGLLEGKCHQKSVINFVILLDSLKIDFVGDALYVPMNIHTKAGVKTIERGHVTSAVAKVTLSSNAPNGHRLKKPSRCMTGFNMPSTAKLITKALGKEHGSQATANLFTGRERPCSSTICYLMCLYHSCITLPIRLRWLMTPDEHIRIRRLLKKRAVK